MIDRRREYETAAFPLCMDASQDGPAFKNEGMSLRAYAAIEFASALLRGWMDQGHHGEDLRNDCVMEGDEMAKAMIKRLEKETQ